MGEDDRDEDREFDPEEAAVGSDVFPESDLPDIGETDDLPENDGFEDLEDE